MGGWVVGEGKRGRDKAEDEQLPRSVKGRNQVVRANKTLDACARMLICKKYRTKKQTIHEIIVKGKQTRKGRGKGERSAKGDTRREECSVG